MSGRRFTQAKILTYDKCIIANPDYKEKKNNMGETLNRYLQKKAIPSFCRICPLICKQTDWTRILSLSLAYCQVPEKRVENFSREWKNAAIILGLWGEPKSCQIARNLSIEFSWFESGIAAREMIKCQCSKEYKQTAIWACSLNDSYAEHKNNIKSKRFLSSVKQQKVTVYKDYTESH